MKRFAFVIVFGLLVLQLFAQDAVKITGVWWNAEKTSKIEVREENGKYSGTVVFIVPGKYRNGQPPKDDQNPDVSLRSRSRLGMLILSGLKYNADDREWQGGRIYDPNSGKTYDCYAWFEEDADILNLKGYVVGIKWLGKSTEWTRVPK